MKPVTTEKRRRAIELLRGGLSTRDAAADVGISHQTIFRIRRQEKITTPMPLPGRPTRLTERDRRALVRLVTSCQANSLSELKHSVAQGTGMRVSKETIRTALRDEGLKAIVKKKKPLLLKRHREHRLEFAQKYEHWTKADWKRVVFSDETKINRLGSDGRSWVWKRPNQILYERDVTPTLKFGGGSLMLWACISSHGIGHACRIDGRMDAALYTQILEGELLQSIEYFGLRVEDIIFQQDNDSKHTSKMAIECLARNHISVLSWPPQSPDLNPIEHLWGYLKRTLAASDPPDGIQELWSRVELEWEKISPSICCDLIDTMPERIQAVLKSKGGYTNY